MEIINVNNRCFLVLNHINVEKFSSQEKIDEYFKNKIYLRKPDSPEVLIVHEIFDGLIEETVTALPPNAEPIAVPEQEPPTSSVDIKI